MTISNIRALKHIRYRHHNASHVMHHAIHVTAQHSQRLFKIPPQTYQISISQRYTRQSSRYLYYSTTPAVTISNSRAETYQISISQHLTRYV